MRRMTLSGCALLAAGLALAPGARAVEVGSVAVAAGADGSYVRQKFGEKGTKTKAESYLFAQGSYFGGKLRDPSLEHEQFLTIANTLAPDLAKQLYLPSKDSKSADLLIVVHWGITDVDEDADHGARDWEQMNKDSGIGKIAREGATRGGAGEDVDRMSLDLDMLNANNPQSSGDRASNAQLLGFSSELKKEEYKSVAMASGMTEVDHVLLDDIQDERYFVILMAYDFNSLKTEAKGGKPKLVWSTHFSMRAIGHSFTAALPMMSNVAANYFGHQVEGLILNAHEVPAGRVEIGEPKTIEDKKN